MPGLLALAMLLTSLTGVNLQANAVELPDIPRDVEYSPISQESVTIDWSPVEGAQE